MQFGERSPRLPNPYYAVIDAEQRYDRHRPDSPPYRAALAELDRDVSVKAVDRLDALYAIQHEITRRILEMESPNDEAGEQPVIRWSPVRY
jgi:hypothetical protein